MTCGFFMMLSRVKKLEHSWISEKTMRRLRSTHAARRWMFSVTKVVLRYISAELAKGLQEWTVPAQPLRRPSRMQI